MIKRILLIAAITAICARAIATSIETDSHKQLIDFTEAMYNSLQRYHVLVTDYPHIEVILKQMGIEGLNIAELRILETFPAIIQIRTTDYRLIELHSETYAILRNTKIHGIAELAIA